MGCLWVGRLINSPRCTTLLVPMAPCAGTCPRSFPAKTCLGEYGQVHPCTPFFFVVLTAGSSPFVAHTSIYTMCIPGHGTPEMMQQMLPDLESTRQEVSGAWPKPSPLPPSLSVSHTHTLVASDSSRGRQCAIAQGRQQHYKAVQRRFAAAPARASAGRSSQKVSLCSVAGNHRWGGGERRWCPSLRSLPHICFAFSGLAWCRPFLQLAACQALVPSLEAWSRLACLCLVCPSLPQWAHGCMGSAS